MAHSVESGHPGPKGRIVMWRGSHGADRTRRGVGCVRCRRSRWWRWTRAQVWRGLWGPCRLLCSASPRTRRRRRRLIAVGVVLAISVVCGSLFAHTSFSTVVGIFAVAYAAAIVASRAPAGLFVLTLCLPVCAVGLSFSDLHKALSLGGLFIASSVFAYVVVLAWPEFDRDHRRRPSRCCPNPSPVAMACSQVWQAPAPRSWASSSTPITSVGHQRLATL